jgi:hypothetical protein
MSDRTARLIDLEAVLHAREQGERFQPTRPGLTRSFGDFDFLEQGDVPSRVVLDFTDTKSEKAAGQKTDAVRAVSVLA